MKKIILIVLCLWSLNSVGQQYVWDSAVFAESHNNTMPVYRMELTQEDEKVVLGYYRDSLNIANQSLYSSKNYGVFLAKYNTLGEMLWVKTIAERMNLVSGNTPSIEIDNLGNIYIGLTYIDTLFVNGEEFPVPEDAMYSNDFAVLKFDAQGNQLLHLRLEDNCSNNLDYDGITTDGDLNIYISGHFYNSPYVPEPMPTCQCQFGTDTLTVVEGEPFIAKYNSNGQELWIKDKVGGISVIEQINTYIYVGGISSKSSISFEGYTLNFPSFYDHAGYIAKFDTSGVFHWAKHFGVQEWDSHLQILDLHIVSENNIVLAGNSYTQSVPNQVFFQNAPTLNGDEWGGDDYFLVSYDNLGNVNWQDVANCTYDDYFHKLTHDSQDNLYAAGKFSGSMYFGTDTIVSYGSIDAMVCSYDSLGSKRWAKNIGGSGLEFARGIGLDHEENLYVLGSTQSSTFHLGEISYELDNTYTQMFLAKLKLSGIGVQEFEPSDAMLLYPNPNTGTFSLSAEKSLESVEIYNLMGERVFAKYYEIPTKQINIESSLSSGIYLVMIKTEDGKYTAIKMIVE